MGWMWILNHIIYSKESGLSAITSLTDKRLRFSERIQKFYEHHLEITKEFIEGQLELSGDKSFNCKYILHTLCNTTDRMVILSKLFKELLRF